MRLCRQLLCTLVCISMILLPGCGQTDRTSTEVTPTEDTTESLRHYLAAAQELVGRNDFAAALAVLEQVQTEDPQVDALMNEIREQMPVALRAVYSIGCSGNLTAEQITLHNIAAESLRNGLVHCSVEYTVPAGMELELLGRRLHYRQDTFRTSGGQGTFVFELSASDLRDMEGKFQLRFAAPDQSEALVDVQLLWPGEEAPVSEKENSISEYEVGYLFYEPRKNGAVEVHSFRVAEEQDRLRFTLDITAQPGLKLLGELSGGVPLWEEERFTQGGEETITLDVPADVLTEYDNISVFFQEDDQDMRNVTAYFPLQIRMTSGQPSAEPERPGYSSRRSWTDAYALHDLVMQELDNDYIRFSLDLTLPGGMYITSHLVRSSDTESLFTAMSIEGRQTVSFDVCSEDLRQSSQMTILLSSPNYENLITLPLGAINARTEGQPLTEPVKLECFTKSREMENVECTVQLLDNEYYRYTLTFTAPAGQLCSLFDPPNGSALSLQFYSAEGQQKFVFDVEKTAADSLTDFTLLAGNSEVIIKEVAALAEVSTAQVDVTVIGCT